MIITNDDATTTKHLIERYARRMTIEQRLAEIIRALHADALSSTVSLNVDLDITLCVLAQALLAALRQRLPGYATVTPDTCNDVFSTPQERSSTTVTRPPSDSPDAPTHPFYAKPISTQTSPSPGAATTPSATNRLNP